MWILREVGGTIAAVLVACLVCAVAGVLGSVGYVARSGAACLVAGRVRAGLGRIALSVACAGGIALVLQRSHVGYAVWVLCVGFMLLGSLGAFIVPGGD